MPPILLQSTGVSMIDATYDISNWIDAQRMKNDSWLICELNGLDLTCCDFTSKIYNKEY